MNVCNESTSTGIQEPSLENCRLCASLLPNNLLFSFCDTIYEEIINNFLPFGLYVPREDHLPKKICRTCIEKLLDVKQIVEGFIEADRKLKDASKDFEVINIKEEREVSDDRLHVEKVFIENDLEVSKISSLPEMECKDPLFINRDEEIFEAAQPLRYNEHEYEFNDKLKDGLNHREIIISDNSMNFGIEKVERKGKAYVDNEQCKNMKTNTVLLLVTRPVSYNKNVTVESSSRTIVHQSPVSLSKSFIEEGKIDFNEDPKYAALKKLLGNDTDAKLVVNAYEQNGGLMPEEARTTIVRAFIRKKQVELLQHFKKGQKFDDWQVDKEEFKILASEIERIFPTESAATYYTAFKVENGTRSKETGKLYNHFEYAKGKLRSQGIIKSSLKSGERTDSVKQIVVLLDQSIRDKLDYLSVHSDNPENVKKYWLETHEARQHIFQSEKPSVEVYINRFKALREQLGRELIEKDFDVLYPGKGNVLFEKWPLIKEHLLRLFNFVPKLPGLDKSYLDLLPTLQPDSQDAVVFYLLWNIVPTGKSKRPQKRKCDSTSNVENEENEGPEFVENPEALQRELFKKLLQGNGKGSEKRNPYMLSVQIDDEDDASLKNLRTTLNLEKLSLYPIILIIGSIINVKKTYVIVNDVWYETNSFLDAVSLSLKTFRTFDCAYPDKARNIWQFVQLAGFDIRIPCEKFCIKVNSMVKEIDAIFKNSVSKS